MSKNLPEPVITTRQLGIVEEQAQKLPWPEHGQAAVGSIHQGVIATSSQSEQPVPTASVAKIITALAVLKKKPISPGDTANVLTLNQDDVNIYNHYTLVGGSRVAVQAGEKLTEYEALEALLLPSANNIADSLAVWAFGSMDKYIEYANAMVKELGLTKTVISDASGFLPTTVSTPSELIRLGQLALKNETIESIVKLKQAEIPVAGTIYNVNRLLSSPDVVGIKTGHTEEAGGCLLFARTTAVNDRYNETIITAVLGDVNLDNAFFTSQQLSEAVANNFYKLSIIKSGDTVGKISTAWGQETEIYATDKLEIIGWKGQRYTPKYVFEAVDSSFDKNHKIGKAFYLNGDVNSSTDIMTRSKISKPSIVWRLLNYF